MVINPLRPARSGGVVVTRGVLAADLDASACIDNLALQSRGLVIDGAVTFSRMIRFSSLPATRSSSLSSTASGDMGASEDMGA